MTAERNFNRIVRQRMRRTGESYTAARRYFRVQYLLDAQAKAGDLPRLDQQGLVEVRDALASRGL